MRLFGHRTLFPIHGKLSSHWYTVFIRTGAPGAKAKFWEGATFRNIKIPIFVLT